jgi:tryptophan-rich sensory protein
LARPEVLPRELERKIGLIWTAIFLLAGLGTALALASDRPPGWKRLQVGLILGCLLLNLCYTYTFTYLRNLDLATGIAATLAVVLTVLVLSVVRAGVWWAAVCHLPHLGWVGFATYVTARIAQLNP